MHWLEYNRDRVCPVCGKKFLMPLEKNVYRMKIDGKVVDYCSWTCYRKGQAALERKKQYMTRNTQKRKGEFGGSPFYFKNFRGVSMKFVLTSSSNDYEGSGIDREWMCKLFPNVQIIQHEYEIARKTKCRDENGNPIDQCRKEVRTKELLVIEINTLEELMDFMKEIDEPLIVSHSTDAIEFFNYPDLPAIEIYDAYREQRGEWVWVK